MLTGRTAWLPAVYSTVVLCCVLLVVTGSHFVLGQSPPSLKTVAQDFLIECLLALRECKLSHLRLREHRDMAG